ncbi:ABC transporter permease [Hoeflea prorocentri]|uniref:ABC transporter permease n=1 Tax=Hoeflea prorocentri TaxID=1922333 RepID=A0A9X3ULM4_9HYPH|nr:ABC transporter permease [Hoeflea prorocentri]MCY6383033.1 ABC transporter permease [Hoeflea prorocentri]MDA5400833.1 ABC transporter permease [Hoeflea prorocentri]
MNRAQINFIIRRIVSSITVLLVVMTLVFLADRQIGDPARMVLGNAATEEAVLELRQRMGLEDPLSEQYVRFIGGIFTGDLGDTFRYGISKPLVHGAFPESRATLPIVLERLPATFFLGAVTILVAIMVAIPIGIYAAMNPRTVADRIIGVFALGCVSVVEYWFALVLILIFAVHLGWLPTSGYGSFSHVILPAIALALRPIGRIAQITRSSIMDELAKPYVAAARGRGIPRWRIAYIHALRNSAVPVITTIGDETVTLVTGVIIVESIFGWPGVGALTVDALAIRDVPLIEATIFVLLIVVLTINLLVDLSYLILDPKLGKG